jgi:hypothetical protein
VRAPAEVATFLYSPSKGIFLGKFGNFFSKGLNKVGKVVEKGKKVKLPNGKTLTQLTQKAEKDFARQSNNWTKRSLFKDKTAKDLDKMFRGRGLDPKGLDPLNGKGSYIHPKSGRKYCIDAKNKGRYREPSHVDISRSENYTGPLKKKRMIYKDE